MKRIYFFLVVCFLALTHSAFTQPIINIPDPNFKNYLVAEPIINLNMDTEIDSFEAASFTGSISCSYLNIADLTGIEAFTSATSLYADGNIISSVMLDSNTALTDIHLNYNQLTSIDVSSLTGLFYLYLSHNLLTAIDISMIPWIYDVDLSYNSLSSLDITNNPGINYLYVDSNNLSALNTDNNYQLLTLMCRTNNISTLNLRQNTWLQVLYCGENPFTCLDLGDNSSLTTFDCMNAPNLVRLNLRNGNNMNLTPSVFGSPGLLCVQVDSSLYSTMNWSNFGGSSYFSDDCGIPTASFIHNAPVCNGTPVVFDQTMANYDWFKWDFGDGDTSTVMVDPSHLYTHGGNFYVTLTVSSCYGHTQPWSDVVLGNPISGYIDYSGGGFADGNVVLLKYDPVYTSFDTIAMNYGFEVAGYYDFGNQFDGQYIIKVFPDTSVLPNAITTYSGNQANWETATIINHTCFAADTMDITLIEISPPTPGSGSLSGEIIEGAGFGRAQGDPIHGVDVKLGISASSIIAHTQTDTAGQYFFNNIPDGTYTIYVDIPGLYKDSTYTLTIGPGSYVWTYLDYQVDSNSIDIIGNIGIENIESGETNGFAVYPNPVRDNSIIKFSVANNTEVKFELFNAFGIKLQTLYNNITNSGDYLLNFNPQIKGLTSGVYFISCTMNGKVSTKRVIIID